MNHVEAEGTEGDTIEEGTEEVINDFEDGSSVSDMDENVVHMDLDIAQGKI